MAFIEKKLMYNRRLLELERAPEIRRPRLLLDSDEETKALRGNFLEVLGELATKPERESG